MKWAQRWLTPVIGDTSRHYRSSIHVYRYFDLFIYSPFVQPINRIIRFEVRTFKNPTTERDQNRIQ